MLSDPHGAYRPPPPAAFPAAPSRRGRIAIAIFAALAVVGAGAGAGALVFDDSPVYPERWDSRVADIATFVEQVRGHRFKHPVRVYFLSPDRYTAVAGGGSSQPRPTAEDRANSAKTVAEYRALGLMDGTPDLLAANETLQDAGTLAFYSPEDDVVNVRGTKMTVGLRVTLAHELTHALQDQYFDLSPIADATTADEQGAARSIVEGDATSVENAYIDALNDADRAEYETESDHGSSDADNDLGTVPDVLQVLFGSYYAVGSAFVSFWQAVPNAQPELSEIDDVLKRLPASSAQLFEPSTYVAGTKPADVAPPGADTESDFEVSSFGVDYLYVMLAERIDPHVALTATDGWAGDSYRATTKGGTMCVSARVEFVTAGDAAEFTTAMNDWKALMPPEAKVRVDAAAEKVASFETCDPGPTVDVGLTGKAGPALAFPVTRLQVAADAVANGRTREQALCYGNAVVSRLTLDDLQAGERTPAIQAAIAAADAACR